MVVNCTIIMLTQNQSEWGYIVVRRNQFLYYLYKQLLICCNEIIPCNLPFFTTLTFSHSIKLKFSAKLNLVLPKLCIYSFGFFNLLMLRRCNFLTVTVTQKMTVSLQNSGNEMSTELKLIGKLYRIFTFLPQWLTWPPNIRPWDFQVKLTRE